MNPTKISRVFYISTAVFEIAIILIYLFVGEYVRDATFIFKTEGVNSTEGNESDIIITSNSIDAQYPMFQDIQVMVFIGFGFLMTFLKKYGYSALAFTFVMSCIVIQLDILLEGLWHLQKSRFQVSLSSLINADVAAAVFLISFGAVLGKINPAQLFFMAFLETFVYVANKYLVEEVLKAVDVGGSMVVHVFGAYFGLAVSLMLGLRSKSGQEKHELEGSTHQSDINAMIGTLFLWMFWPSFNAALATGNEKHRIIINTYLSLTASCIITFVMSAEITKSRKFRMVYIQNATLAGGVGIGALCNLNIYPYGAIIVGLWSASFAVYGYRFLQNCLAKHLRLHDTCGVHFLHGLPGILGGFIGAVLSMFSNKLHENRAYEIYPAMSISGLGRSASAQGGFQFAALGVTLLFSIAGGLATGAFISLVLPVITFEQYFNDEIWWDEESGEGD